MLNNFTHMEWDEVFMRQVYLSALQSLDPRTKIGAVLVKDRIAISMGYNGLPRGVKDLEERYLDRELKLKLICHAESNSVLNSILNGISPRDSTCYSNGLPCSECAKTLIQSGVKEIVVHKQWPYQTPVGVEYSKLMLNEAGINIRYFDKRLRLIGYWDGKAVEV
jgi:dCMP deaminase